MGMWRSAFRPHCLGLFVEKGTLYAEQDSSDAGVPIPLDDAKIFLDIEVGSRRPIEVPDGVTCHRPAVPPNTKGNKLYTITVFTSTDDLYVGYPASGGEARNVFRAIEKLVKSTR